MVASLPEMYWWCESQALYEGPYSLSSSCLTTYAGLKVHLAAASVEASVQREPSLLLLQC